MSLFRNEAPILGDGTQVADNYSTNLYKVPKRETVTVSGLGASSGSQAVFVVPTNDSFVLDAVATSFGTASSSGTLQVEYAPSGTATGSGTNQLTGTVSLAGTANTPVFGTVISAPTVATSGGRFNIILGGTLTSLANCAVTLTFRRV